MLKRFAADAKADVERVRIGDFVGANNVRTYRRECVEALADGPLRCGELHIAGAHVIHNRVAENVILPIRCGYVLRAPADYNRELSFIIRLLGRSGEHDRIAWSDDCIGKFREDRRRRWNLHLRLDRMVAIVESYAEDLLRMRNRSG